MPTCNHCDASFPEDGDYDEGTDAETEYVTHLRDEHFDDLTRIDKRRIEQHSEITLEQPVTWSEVALQTAILAVGLGLSIVLVYAVLKYDIYSAL